MTDVAGGAGDGGDGGDGSDVTFGSIEPIEIQEEMERSFLEYAMSVITMRALPDVRDGLKPVQRRILYGMYDLGVGPNRAHMKCARVSGDVMGRFHPHGDSAIYEALARMAQDFSLRHPLIDGHGNFGSPDDPPAASRYCVTGDTRVRLPDGSSLRMDQLIDLPPDSEAEADFEVVDKDGKPVHVSKVFNSGVHPTKRVVTDEGFEIRGSHNHPLLCLEDVFGVPMFQWLQLDEIRVGTIVCTEVRSEVVVKDRVSLVNDFVISELTMDGRQEDAEWFAQSQLDRPDCWHHLRLTVLDRIGQTEAYRTVAPIMDSGYRFSRVASVEDAGPAEVYSVKVDSEDHSFLAGGFVNHNTECRLAPLAMQMLAGIDEDTVDFVDNYSGEITMPAVLPARFPNLLVNGNEGIAVGMATKIPPHNLGEVIDAVVHLIDNPEATPDDLMQFVKGPDFPTGAYILGRAGILDAFRTGRGSIRLRAKAEIEETKRGTAIVVTELPYQTSAGSIATRIRDLVDSRELDGVRDVNDESAQGKTRLVIHVKRDANANVLLNNLYKHTPLQTSYGVNTVALVDGIPRTLNLRDALIAYVEHQVDVITRRSEFRLAKAQARAHIVEGLIKALDMIDAIITLIRGSEDRGAARDGLMAPPFEFTDIQANHILDMTLGRLTRLGRSELEGELAELRQTIAELEGILADPVKLRSVIKEEITDIRERFATPRLSQIILDPGELGAEDLIEDEELVVTMTRAGYIKAVQAGAFRTQGRGGRGVQGARLREEDLVTQILHTTAHAFLLFFSNTGRVYRLKAHEVPMKERTARGTAVVNLLPLAPGETIQAIIATRDYPEDRFLFFATRQGQVKKTPFSEYDKSRREGFIAINLRDNDQLVKVVQTSGNDDIFMVSRAGMTIRFNEEEVRAMGRDAAGVRGMRMREDDEVVSVDVAADESDILIVTDAGYGKRTKLERFNRQGRGGQGVRGIRLTARRGFVVAAFMVGLDDEIFLISSGGVTIRTEVRGISSQGRDATGVRVMQLDADQTVASVAPILAIEEEQ